MVGTIVQETRGMLISGIFYYGPGGQGGTKYSVMSNASYVS